MATLPKMVPTIAIVFVAIASNELIGHIFHYDQYRHCHDFDRLWHHYRHRVYLVLYNESCHLNSVTSDGVCKSFNT